MIARSGAMAARRDRQREIDAVRLQMCERRRITNAGALGLGTWELRCRDTEERIVKAAQGYESANDDQFRQRAIFSHENPQNERALLVVKSRHLHDQRSACGRRSIAK